VELARLKVVEQKVCPLGNESPPLELSKRMPQSETANEETVRLLISMKAGIPVGVEQGEDSGAENGYSCLFEKGQSEGFAP